MRHVAPITPRLEDLDAERIRREHDRAIRALQTMPTAELVVISGIQLASGVVTVVRHPLGRAPQWLRESCIRTLDGTTPASGVVTEVRGGVDRNSQLELVATGFGTTVVVDLAVM